MTLQIRLKFWAKAGRTHISEWKMCVFVFSSRASFHRGSAGRQSAPKPNEVLHKYPGEGKRQNHTGLLRENRILFAAVIRLKDFTDCFIVIFIVNSAYFVGLLFVFK